MAPLFRRPAPLSLLILGGRRNRTRTKNVFARAKPATGPLSRSQLFGANSAQSANCSVTWLRVSGNCDAHVLGAVAKGQNGGADGRPANANERAEGATDHRIFVARSAKGNQGV